MLIRYEYPENGFVFGGYTKPKKVIYKTDVSQNQQHGFALCQEFFTITNT